MEVREGNGAEPEMEKHGARRSARWVFIGEQGLRAGWACLLFLILLVALVAGGSALGRHFLPHPQSSGSIIPPPVMLVGEGFSAAAVLLVTFAMARIERRRFASYGLGDAAFLPRFGGGLLCGFAAISALVGLLWSMHLLTLSGPLMHGRVAWTYALLWAGGFLLVALFEENLLRGYLLFTLSRGVGFFWGAVLLSVAFGAIHGTNKGETPVGLFSAAAVGLLFCLSIWYTRSLWWAIGFHAAWDWGESFFWSTSDSGMMVQGHLLQEQPSGQPLWSGGATGPEGSLLVFPVLLVSALLMFLWWRRRGPAAGAGTTI